MSRCCVGTSDAWLRFVWAVGKCHPHQWESCSSSCNYFPVEFWEFSAGFGCVIIAHTRHTAMGIQISLFLNLKSMFSARRVIKQNTPLPHSYIYDCKYVLWPIFFFIPVSSSSTPSQCLSVVACLEQCRLAGLCRFVSYFECTLRCTLQWLLQRNGSTTRTFLFLSLFYFQFVDSEVNMFSVDGGSSTLRHLSTSSFFALFGLHIRLMFLNRICSRTRPPLRQTEIKWTRHTAEVGSTAVIIRRLLFCSFVSFCHCQFSTTMSVLSLLWIWVGTSSWHDIFHLTIWLKSTSIRNAFAARRNIYREYRAMTNMKKIEQS